MPLCGHCRTGNPSNPNESSKNTPSRVPIRSEQHYNGTEQLEERLLANWRRASVHLTNSGGFYRWFLWVLLSPQVLIMLG